MTKIRCEIRESARYLNGKGDITATRKNSSERLHLFVCMLGIREILRLGNGTDANQTDMRFFFFRLLLLSLERTEEFGKAMKKIAGSGISVKKMPGIRGQIYRVK